MYKKLLSFFLCLLFIPILFPVCSEAANTNRYIVTAPKTDITDRASLLGATVAELQHNDYINVLEISGDFAYVTVNSSGVSGWVYLPHISYAGPAADTDVTGIHIDSLPLKTAYTEDEEPFDASGLSVSAQRKNAADIRVNGYRIYVPDLETCGTKKVYVCYTPPGTTLTFSADFDITVIEVPLASLSVETYPTKALSSYIENQPLDLSGLTLRAKYTDGRPDRLFKTEEILADGDFLFTVKHGDKLSRGSHTVNIYYKYPRISCSLNVSVRKRELVSFSITSPPAATTVYSRKMPDLTGLVLTAVYDNGEKINVKPSDCAIVCDPSAFIIGGGNKMTLTYEGRSVSIDFTYALLEKTGLRLRLPQKLTFILGEPIDLSALEVYYVYSSEEVEKTLDYTRSPIDPMKTEAQTVVVTAGNFSTSFTIHINPYYRRGDINGDGAVDAYDARLALRASVNLIKLGGVTLTAGDVDRDGDVDAADARLILRATVGLEDFLEPIRNTKI